MSKSSINTYIDGQAPDNDTQLIKPINLRNIAKRLNNEGYNLIDNDSDDINEGTTNLFVTDKRVADVIAQVIQSSADFAITWAYDPVNLTLTPTISGGGGVAAGVISFIIGDGTTTIFNLNHGLSTYEIQITVDRYQLSDTERQPIDAIIKKIDLNTLQIDISQFIEYDTINTRYLVVIEGGATSGGGGGSDVFTSDVTFVLSGGKTMGKYSNGQTAPWTGLTAVEALIEAATEYLAPAFTSFSLSGQSQKIEVGTSITAGSKTFLWGTSNSGNVQANSIAIRNQTAGVDLATGLANDGSEAVTISAINMTTETTQTFRISGNKTVGGAMGVADFSINSRYKVFYGPAASAPNNSATARALGGVRFRDDGNTFNLDTGSTQRIFAVIIPSSMSLVSVVDLDALNAVITSEYVLTTFNVNDAAGTAVAYKAYIMTQSIPYSSNHRHQITIG